jgi:hypothetical protein
VSALQVHVGLQGVGSATTPQCSSSSGNSQRTCSATEAATAAGSAPTAGVFTRKALKQNDTMAVIPVRLGYRIKPGMAKLVSRRARAACWAAALARLACNKSSKARHVYIHNKTLATTRCLHPPLPGLLNFMEILTQSWLHSLTPVQWLWW